MTDRNGTYDKNESGRQEWKETDPIWNEILQLTIIAVTFPGSYQYFIDTDSLTGLALSIIRGESPGGQLLTKGAFTYLRLRYISRKEIWKPPME